MVAKVRHGVARRAVAREFKVSLATVQRWVTRAHGQRLDRAAWGARPPVPRRIHRTPAAVEELVVSLRHELRGSDLGEYGARAIHRTLVVRGQPAPPAVRTIGRILQRRGELDRRGRVRQPPPPRGWYLPVVALGRAELDSFDTIAGLVIQDGPAVEVLTAISLHGGLPAAWPARVLTAQRVAATLVTHWRQAGLPAYAQFDNATLFQGAHQHRDVMSRVMRLCLSLGVTPVFTPPREHGFQAAIESFNARWQGLVWTRFHHASLRDLLRCSARYVRALRERRAARLEAAPPRQPFPGDWAPDFQRHPTGTVVFLRRTDDAGRVYLLGQTFTVTPTWAHRLVRAEVELERHRIRFYALQRRQPAVQPLLHTAPYALPHRRFR